MLSHFPGLKAIFFDLDNVLVFSEPTHYRAWQQVLHQFAIDTSQLDFQSMIGLSDQVQAKLFKEQFNLSPEIDAIWEMKKNTYLELITAGALETPKGRNAFLEKVSNSFITGVVSSCNQQAVHHVLQSENIASYFDFIICHEDCTRHKPDPMPYQKALSLAQVESHEALVIEDSFLGVTSAQKADIPVIGIFKDQTPDQIHSNVKYFNDFEEIDSHFFNTLIPASLVDIKMTGA